MQGCVVSAFDYNQAAAWAASQQTSAANARRRGIVRQS
jgi:hypothetical protein